MAAPAQTPQKTHRRIHHTVLRLDAAADPDGAPAIAVDMWGFLRARAPVTRTGVLEYREPDGSVSRQYRPPDEVFAPASLASMHLVPVMLEHPAEGDRRVTVDNAHRAIGSAADPTAQPDTGQVIATFMITDAAAQQAILSGTHREISCGYVCQYDLTPGTTPEGESYDLIQRNIRYNHIVATRKGRAGESIAFPRMDSADADDQGATVDVRAGVCFDGTETHDKRAATDPKHETPNMSATATDPKPTTRTVKVDSVEIVTDSAAASAIEQLQAKCDSLAASLKKAESAASPEAIRAAAAARVALVVKSTAAHPELKADSLSDSEIRVAVVKHLEGDDIAGKPDAYVEARFDSALKHAAKGKAAHDEAVASHAQVRVDAASIPVNQGVESPVEKARKAMLEANANAWKTVQSA